MVGFPKSSHTYSYTIVYYIIYQLANGRVTCTHVSQLWRVASPYKIHAISCMNYYLVYNNMLKGILHKECATFTLGLKSWHRQQILHHVLYDN